MQAEQERIIAEQKAKEEAERKALEEIERQAAAEAEAAAQAEAAQTKAAQEEAEAAQAKAAAQAEAAQEEAASQATTQQAAPKKAAPTKNVSTSSNSSSKSSPASASSSSSSSKKSSSGFIRPSGGYTTSPYGYRVHPVHGTGKLHGGMDFGGGGPIVAAQSGTVSAAQYNSGWGWYVKIDHGNGLATLYAHMVQGSLRVSPGQQVSQGQQIGTMGTTGTSTGVHLHFEVYKNGARVNPAPYLGM